MWRRSYSSHNLFDKLAIKSDNRRDVSFITNKFGLQFESNPPSLELGDSFICIGVHCRCCEDCDGGIIIIQREVVR